MRRVIRALCGTTLATALIVSVANAATADAVSAKQAITEAATLQAQAMKLDDGWSTTQAALKQAHAAYAKHDFATALAKARHAQTLARISILQAQSQKTLWRNEVVH